LRPILFNNAREFGAREDKNHLGSGPVVPMARPRGALEQRGFPAKLDPPDHLLELFQRGATGPKQYRSRLCHVKHRGLNSDGGGAAVQDQGDPVSEVLKDVRRCG